jgi:DNA-binding IclR family transcriptional regulator
MSVREPGFDGRQPKAVNNALAVLGVVAAAEPGITAREIHQQLVMPRATAYRILQHLVAEGYLVRSPDLRGFALGNRMQEFFRAAARHLEPPPAMPQVQLGPAAG